MVERITDKMSKRQNLIIILGLTFVLLVGIAEAKQTPTITWSNPANITYGTPLNGIQNDATSDTPGTLTYTPANNTVLSAGDNQPLHVDFTPDDTANYSNAGMDVYINVSKATSTITWSNPANITYGTPLNGIQNDATSDTPGTLTYTPANNTVLSVVSTDILP